MSIKRNLIIFVTMLTAILLSAGISLAATYYVSPTGSAAWSQCTNISTPCSVQTGFTNAVAGDTVYFRGGTYNIPAKPYMGGDSTYRSYYEPANSGTSINWITFAAYPGETPIVNGTAGGAGDDPEGVYATIFGVYHKNYIVFDGFTFQSDGGTKMARMHIGGNDGSTYPTDHVTIKNCIFNGGTTITSSTDNKEGLRVDSASNVTAERCKFYNYRQTSDWHNTSGYKGYQVSGLRIKNSEFYNCSTALYLKRFHTNPVIEYNFIHDNQAGIEIFSYNAGTEFDSPNAIVHDNVIVNNSYQGISFYSTLGDGIAYADDAQIYNNTIYGSNTTGDTYGLDFRFGRRTIVYNNIYYGPNTKFVAGGQDNATFTEIDYNQYGNLGSFKILWNKYGTGSTTYTSIASWQTSGKEIGGGNPDTHSLASNPLFQNGSGTLSKLSDFALAAGSPCKGTGKPGIGLGDMGANISLVGIQVTTPITTPTSLTTIPTPPSNLIVN